MNKSSKINAKTFIIMALLILALLIAVAAQNETYQTRNEISECLIDVDCDDKENL